MPHLHFDFSGRAGVLRKLKPESLRRSIVRGANLAVLAVLSGAMLLGCSSIARPILCSDASPSSAPATQPTLKSLSEHPVVGLLGLPLGTVTNIQATIIAGSELGQKYYDGIYLLRVTQVAERSMEKPIIIEFNAPSYMNVKLARDLAELYEMKTGKKIGQLDSKTAAALEKDYVGTSRRLLVYETGGYSGIPQNLPRDIFPWQDRGFVFSTSLIVLAERG